MYQKPKCWSCGHDLIWGGDHDYEDADDREYIESNLTICLRETASASAIIFDKSFSTSKTG